MIGIKKKNSRNYLCKWTTYFFFLQMASAYWKDLSWFTCIHD